MRASAWACIGVVGLLVGAACGGAAFTASNGDAGATSGGDGGKSGSGSGSGSGSSGSGSSGSGGSSGSSGSSSGSSNGGTSDGGGSADAATIDGGTTCGTMPTRCGQMTCNGGGGQQGDVCCVNANGGTAGTFTCAACNCGCETQLECAKSADCAFPQVCCAEPAPCGNGNTHFVATCKDRTSCSSGSGKVLCNPNSAASPECGTASCSADPRDVGIPANAGYGICQ